MGTCTLRALRGVRVHLLQQNGNRSGGSTKTPCRHCDGVGCFYCGFTGWTHPKGKYD